MTTKKIAEIITITLFIAIIWLPTTSMVFNLEPDVSLDEKRVLADMPELKGNWKSIIDYPSDFGKYYQDQWGFRKLFILTYNNIMTKYLKSVKRNNVMLGQNKWLYWTGGNSFDQYSATSALTEKDLERIKTILEERQSFCRHLGIRYLFIIVPNKHSIYDKYIPDWMQKVSNESNLDRIIKYLEDNDSTVEILDLRPALLEAKKTYQVYYKTDTHWNDIGAFIAYKTIMEKLSEWFPQIEPRSLSDYKMLPYINTGGDLGHMLGLKGEYKIKGVKLEPKFERRARKIYELDSFYHSKENTKRLIITKEKLEKGHTDFGILATETGNSSLPKAVMFRDSFTSSLMPNMAEHFERVFYYWVEYEKDEYDFYSDIVKHEMPDVVMTELAERVILQILDNTPEVRQAHSKNKR